MGLQPTTTSRPAFGRRIPPQQRQTAAPERSARAADPVVVQPPEPVAAAAIVPDEISVDEELQAWKDARGSRFKIPWRQVYLMASLCFGIASFVLPDSVNDNVEYLLWGLAATSAYAWFTGRKKTAEIKDASGA